MGGKIRNLLPLSTLPAFESAARHKSFTLAAKELNLSQAAVSRQIKHLEQRLGVDLFLRQHRAISLTENGEQLYRTVGVALRLIGDSARNLRPEHHSQSISVGTDLAFAHFWLIPRLDLFQNSSQAMSISVTASDNEQDCLRQGVDIPIMYGSGNWPGFDAHLLMDEEIFPVCSPSYLDNLGEVSQPADLLKGQLVHVKGGPVTWVSWQEWLGNYQLDIPPEAGGIELNSLPWTIQAACAGQGIALGWKYLLHDLLASRALVRPIPHSMCTDRHYYMLRRQDGSTDKVFDQIYQNITQLINNV